MTDNCNCRIERHEEACEPNPHCEHFDREVATWKTIRHYEVRSHDTLEPVCVNGLRHENFEGRVFGENRECRPEPFEEGERCECRREQHEHRNCCCHRNCCGCGFGLF